MRIEDLKIFVDDVQNHSMNIAAEKNFTTPQNLSKIIKRMEDELNVVLFTRSKKGSELTREGENFYLHIIEVLKHYKEAIDSVNLDETKRDGQDEPETSRKLSVICTSGVLSYSVMNAYNKMKNEHKKIVLDNEEINFSEPQRVIAYINEKERDIIACFVPQEDIDSFTKALPYYSLLHVIFDEMVLVVSKSNPLGHRAMITLDEIQKQNLIAFKDFTLADSILEKNVQYQILTNSHAEALKQIKISDSYCTLLFKRFCDMNKEDFDQKGVLRMIRLDHRMYGTYLILVKKDKINDECIREFLSKMEEDFRR